VLSVIMPGRLRDSFEEAPARVDDGPGNRRVIEEWFSQGRVVRGEPFSAIEARSDRAHKIKRVPFRRGQTGSMSCVLYVSAAWIGTCGKEPVSPCHDRGKCLLSILMDTTPSRFRIRRARPASGGRRV
jgi:hypothetical protein